ncbi:HAD-IA family hydrolase [Streptomyces anulatus]|nr:HAD-IA family hydrolase [Streptomyces anulatus]
MTAIPCVIELLEQARRAELPCAVASGATRQLVGPGLNTLGLAGEFDTVVARENVTRGKPDPKLYLIAARRLGVEPEHCLAVDDAPDGIATARAAGMHLITVLAGHLAPTGPEAAASGSARGQALPAASSGPLPRPAPRQKLRPPPSGRRRPDPGRHRP